LLTLLIILLQAHTRNIVNNLRFLIKTINRFSKIK
jgi:hypothetical protein